MNAATKNEKIGAALEASKSVEACLRLIAKSLANLADHLEIANTHLREVLAVEAAEKKEPKRIL